jgi:hypothetical protein
LLEFWIILGISAISVLRRLPRILFSPHCSTIYPSLNHINSLISQPCNLPYFLRSQRKVSSLHLSLITFSVFYSGEKSKGMSEEWKKHWAPKDLVTTSKREELWLKYFIKGQREEGWLFRACHYLQNKRSRKVACLHADSGLTEQFTPIQHSITWYFVPRLLIYKLIRRMGDFLVWAYNVRHINLKP